MKQTPITLQELNGKPVPVKLKELKPELAKWAFEEDRSMHNLIISLLRKAVQNRMASLKKPVRR